jgi:hypothetical protein
MLKSYDDYYEEPALTLDENKIKFSKNYNRKKISKGFVIEERNDKLPLLFYQKKGIKVNNIILSFHVLHWVCGQFLGCTKVLFLLMRKEY